MCHVQQRCLFMFAFCAMLSMSQHDKLVIEPIGMCLASSQSYHFPCRRSCLGLSVVFACKTPYGFKDHEELLYISRDMHTVVYHNIPYYQHHPKGCL